MRRGRAPNRALVSLCLAATIACAAVPNGPKVAEAAARAERYFRWAKREYRLRSSECRARLERRRSRDDWSGETYREYMEMFDIQARALEAFVACTTSSQWCVAPTKVARNPQTNDIIAAGASWSLFNSKNISLLDACDGAVVACGVPRFWWGATEGRWPKILGEYDYNGDRHPEVVVATEELDNAVIPHRSHTPERYLHGRVFQATSRGIELYAPTATYVISGMRDIDGDGRPDLLSRLGYTVEGHVDCAVDDGASYALLGPELALHSREDGTFSASDAVARAYAETVCASRPLRLQPEEAAEDERYVDIVCARVRGVPASVLRERIAVAAAATECKKFYEDVLPSVERDTPFEGR
jgi:hypothetical protein